MSCLEQKAWSHHHWEAPSSQRDPLHESEHHKAGFRHAYNILSKAVFPLSNSDPFVTLLNNKHRLWGRGIVIIKL